MTTERYTLVARWSFGRGGPLRAFGYLQRVTTLMMDRMHYQIELSGSTATLYVAGSLEADHAATLCAACGALPPNVRMLRLDLNAADTGGPAAMDAVRALLRHWRVNRGGEVRLSLRAPHALDCSDGSPDGSADPTGPPGRARLGHPLAAACR